MPLSRGELEARVAGARAAPGALLRALPAVLRAACAMLLARRQRLRQPAQPAHDQVPSPSVPAASSRDEIHNNSIPDNERVKTTVFLALFFNTYCSSLELLVL